MLWPWNKPKAIGSTDVVVDLDDIVECSIVIKIHGKNHEMRPLTTETFFDLINRFSELQSEKTKAKTAKDLAKSYHGIYRIVLPSVTIKDVEKMTPAQCAAMFTAILKRIGGDSAAAMVQSTGTDEASQKKKANQPQ